MFHVEQFWSDQNKNQKKVLTFFSGWASIYLCLWGCTKKNLDTYRLRGGW